MQFCIWAFLLQFNWADSTMHNLDDYYYFYLVVKHGGFSAASEASLITKSKLSRRILALEEQYNVSLIQRSTRYFKVTPLGQEFYEECSKVVLQMQCADNVLLKQLSEPEGLIKISCPNMMMQFQIRSLLNSFLKQYPKVHVELELTSRRVDLIHDDIDLAIRTNFNSTQDSSLIVRDVIKTDHCLVGSKQLLEDRVIESFADLQHFPSIVLGTQKNHYAWHMQHIEHHESFTVPLNPRVKSNDLAGVYYAALDGLGIADLPYLTVEKDIQAGHLVHVLPEWRSNVGTVQLVYASRKGQRLAMSRLIEFLVDGLRNLQECPGYQT